MEDRFSKMTTAELEKFKSDASKELNKREEARKQEILKREELEAETNLVKIDLLLDMCQHAENNGCSDLNIKEDVFSHYDYPTDIVCIRCYLLSCKKYCTAPNFRPVLHLERYEVLSR